MRYLGIDPGNILTAYTIIDENLKPVEFAKLDNEEFLKILYDIKKDMDYVSIEMIGHYGTGMAAGKTVFDTCIFIGRILEVTKDCKNVKLIMRAEEKITLCGTMRAKDGNIIQALVDRFAPYTSNHGKGTKKDMGWFYGMTADCWQSTAVIVTAYYKYIKDTL